MFLSEYFLYPRWGKLKDGIRLLACKCEPYNYPAHSSSGLRNDGNGLGLNCWLQRAASWRCSLGVRDHKLRVTSCKGLPQRTVTGHPQLLLSLFQASGTSLPRFSDSGEVAAVFLSLTCPTVPPKQRGPEELTLPRLPEFSPSCVSSQKIRGVISMPSMHDAQHGH